MTRKEKEQVLFETWKEAYWTDEPNQDIELEHEIERIASLSNKELDIELSNNF